MGEVKWVFLLVLAPWQILCQQGYNMMTSSDKKLLTGDSSSESSSDGYFRGYMGTPQGVVCSYNTNAETCKDTDESSTNSTEHRLFCGAFNNQIRPEIGMRGTPLLSAAPRFSVKFNGLRTAADGSELPNARVVSNSVFKRGERPSTCPAVSDLFVHFVQFLEHDMIRTVFPENPADCTCADSDLLSTDSECASIPIAPDDPDFGGPDHMGNAQPIECIKLKRVLKGDSLDCKDWAEVINMNTHWLDLDIIYREDLKKTNGKLKVSHTNKKDFLPKCDVMDDDCPPCGDEAKSRKSNEPRAHACPMQTLLHTMFHRNHNLMVDTLKARYSGLPGKMYFQYARKINIAIWQNIVYKEVLPIIIGEEAMKEFMLEPLDSGFFEDYDESIDARVSDALGIALRFGHSMIKKHLTLENSNGELSYEPLIDHFGDCTFIETNEEADLLRGVMSYGAQFDNCVTTSLKPVVHDKSIIDIMAIDVQRGRDMGMAGYNRFRQFCRKKNFGAVASFDDLHNEISSDDIKMLKSLYGNVNDIDLVVGMMLEQVWAGDRIVGPTIACIIAEQFRRLKFGDRFYYENRSEHRDDQVVELVLSKIRDVNFATLACWVLNGLDEVPKAAFLFQQSSKLTCTDVPKPDELC